MGCHRLLISTNKQDDYAASINLQETFNIPMWRNVAMLSLYSLYTHRQTIGYCIDTAKVKDILIIKARSLHNTSIK
jgi:hypothetical protein